MVKVVSQVTFEQQMLRQAYQRVNGLGDRLKFIKNIINWEKFRSIIASVFYDNAETGGRPHTDEVLVMRVLALQSFYGLSDEELEFQLNDRLCFMNFVDFPEKAPDFSTIWKIRDRLVEANKDKLVWNELQRQLDAIGYKIEKGVIQDASFVEADLGRKRYSKEKKAKKRGEKIEYTPRQFAHIDRDASFSVKHGQVHFGYKNHVKLDVKHHLVRKIETTTASPHDAKVNLVKKGDPPAYRDKGYFGTPLPKGVIDKTMKRATRARKLNGGEQLRNRAISRIRAPGERPFGVIKCVFDGGCTFVKTLARVRIKEMFKFFAYNLYQLFTLERKHALA